MNRSDLVVREHQRDEDRLIPKGGPDLIGFDLAESIRREVRRLETFFLELLARIEHRLVFREARDDVISLFAVEPRDTEDREIVRLCCSRREDDFFRGAAEEIRHLLPRLVHRGFRLPAVEMIAGGRVSERSRQVRHHGVRTLGSIGVVAWLSM